MHPDAFTSHLEMSYRLSVGIILGLGGVVIFATAGRFGRTVDIFLRMRVNDALRFRLLAAAEARDRADQEHLVLYGRAIGALAVLCAALSFVPSIAMIAPYSAFVVGAGCISLAAFMRSRAQFARRVAFLEVRHPWPNVPLPMIVVSALAAVTPSALLVYPTERWSAIGACLGSLLLVYVGVQMAEIPSRMCGQDLTAEQFVDKYVRRHRAQSIIVMGCGLAFMTLALGGIQLGLSVPPMHRLLLMLAEFVPMGVMVMWSSRLGRLMYAKPSAGDLAELEAL